MPTKFQYIQTGLDFYINPNIWSVDEELEEKKSFFTQNVLPEFLKIFVPIEIALIFVFLLERYYKFGTFVGHLKTIRKNGRIAKKSISAQIMKDFKKNRKTFLFLIYVVIISFILGVISFSLTIQLTLSLKDKASKFGL